MFFKKNNQEVNVPAVEEDIVSTESKKTKKPIEEDEYIWVEGYKGTPGNMICTNTYFKVVNGLPCNKVNEQKYELNKEVSLDDGKGPKTCKNGFHFCLKLEDVFAYYKYDFSNRYFKVRGYVKKEDYDNIKDKSNTKLAAKKIILYEEIFPEYDDVKDCLKYVFKDNKNAYTYQMPKELFEDINNSDLTLNDFIRKYVNDGMIALGYSSTFVMLLVDKYKEDIDIARIMHMYTMAKAFKEEGVSVDMAVSMLLKE